MSRRQRARMTEKAFERLLTETETVAGDPDVGYRGVQGEVRDNLKLSLQERKTVQDIKESRQRIATDKQLLLMVNDEIVGRNFVNRDDERERVRGVLVGMRFPFADQLAETLYPRIRNSTYAEDVIEAWRRTHTQDPNDGDGSDTR